MDIEVKKILDATGLSCPMPLVKTKKVIDELGSNDILEVHTTDTGSKSDLTAWAKSTGHKVIKQTEENNVIKFWIQKK